jgi:predicted metal-dependent hydrolase
MQKTSLLIVDDLEIVVERKAIKNINLAVYPPDGRVRVSAPLQLSDESLRSAIISRLSWIKKKKALLIGKPKRLEKKLVSGEVHYLFGKKLVLQVVFREQWSGAYVKDDDTLILLVQADSPVEKRLAVMNDWYREQLSERIPPLLTYWQQVIGVEATEWRIKRMKTRWGTCNITQKRIWLNLELAKMSPECLEYVVVHELVHLLERYHNKRFWGFMDSFLPTWRVTRNVLKNESLATTSPFD